MNFTFECEQRIDSRLNAEVSELPGMLPYGHSTADAMLKLRNWLFALLLIGLKLASLNLRVSVFLRERKPSISISVRRLISPAAASPDP